jgi:hypothetical protein
MDRISFLDELSADDVQSRLSDGTFDARDQMWILNQACAIALGTMMEFAMDMNHPEGVAESVANVISLMVMAAPPEEREKIQGEIMGNSNS